MARIFSGYFFKKKLYFFLLWADKESEGYEEARLVKKVRVNKTGLADFLTKLYRQERGSRKSHAAGPAAKGEAKKDRLELSGSMEFLQRELARLEEEPDAERAEKLAALARQIESGQYRIDEEELAEIMLDEASRLQ